MVRPPSDDENGTGEPPLVDAAGRLTPPPAPAARSQDRQTPREAFPAHERKRRRPTPQPADEPESPPAPEHVLVLTLQRSGNPDRDRERLQKLHSFLIQFPGHDRFCFILQGGPGRAARLDYPKYPIEITEDSLKFARKLLGEENVRVDDLPAPGA